MLYRGINNGEFHIGARYETIELDETEGRFINEFDAIIPQEERNNFFTAEAAYIYRNLDTPAFPTLGMEVSLTTGLTMNTDEEDTFGYLIPELTFHHKISADGRFVFNTTSKGHIIFGDDFEFYQAASIGGNDGLRGYRNQRFTGKNSFYQSSNLLFNFNRYKTSVLPVEVGIFAGFDLGRIWVDDDLVLDPEFNNESWNNSIGGGFFMNATDLFALNLGLFNSDDGNRFYVGFNFGF